MEKLARKLAREIALSLSYDGEKEAVVAYGLITILQMLLTVLPALVLGFLAGAPAEAMIVCFSVSILRRYSGGIHAGSPELCVGMGVAYCAAAAFLSRRLLAPLQRPAGMLAAMLVIFFLSFLTVSRYAPVDSPNKPIRTPEKRKRMRRGSFLVLCAYFILSVLLFAAGSRGIVSYSYGISLLFGIAWQSFTLTSPGAAFLHRVDSLFREEVNRS